MTGLGIRVVPLMPPTRVESCSLAHIGAFSQGLSCLTHSPFLLPVPLSLLPAVRADTSFLHMLAFSIGVGMGGPFSAMGVATDGRSVTGDRFSSSHAIPGSLPVSQSAGAGPMAQAGLRSDHPLVSAGPGYAPAGVGVSTIGRACQDAVRMGPRRGSRTPMTNVMVHANLTDTNPNRVHLFHPPVLPRTSRFDPTYEGVLSVPAISHPMPPSVTTYQSVLSAPAIPNRKRRPGTTYQDVLSGLPVSRKPTRSVLDRHAFNGSEGAKRSCHNDRVYHRAPNRPLEGHDLAYLSTESMSDVPGFTVSRCDDPNN